MAIIEFLTYQKQIPWNLVPVILQTNVLCYGHYTKLLRTLHFWEHIFGSTFFITHFLVSVADCGLMSICFEVTHLKMNHLLHLLRISPADLVSCNTSQIFSSCTYWLLKSINGFKINVITSQLNAVRKQEASSVVRRLFNLLFLKMILFYFMAPST